MHIVFIVSLPLLLPALFSLWKASLTLLYGCSKLSQKVNLESVCINLVFICLHTCFGRQFILHACMHVHRHLCTTFYVETFCCMYIGSIFSYVLRTGYFVHITKAACTSAMQHYFCHLKWSKFGQLYLYMQGYN